jgi:uncharacterized protein YdhG (YjbR/CyaY superfamily)
MGGLTLPSASQPRTDEARDASGAAHTILEIVPDAEQVISYRIPAFRVQGKVVAGFAAFKDHLSYLPFSGSVLGRRGDELSPIHDD